VKTSNLTVHVSVSIKAPAVLNLLQILIREGLPGKSLIAVQVRSEEERLGENNLEFAEQNEEGYKSDIFVSGMKLDGARRMGGGGASGRVGLLQP
jgi:hypothetical protein